MVMKMMDTDEEESTRDLADLCFQRTLGNPFFVIEFMSMLKREDLIQFNIGTMKWVYKVSAIEEATVSTANVVAMLKSRMQKMPEDVQVLLQVAACLGPAFRSSILEIIWKNLSYVETKGVVVSDLTKLISFIESELLVEAWAGDNRYRWVHDKVQEAALSLVQVDELALKFDLGKALYYNLQGKELEDSLFDIADLITTGNRTISVEFASLCLKAATKAKSLSAFHSATRYAKSGIEMLPEDIWTSNPTLAIELNTIGAQVELALGRVEESKNYCDAVLCRKGTEVDRQIPLKLVEIQRLATVEMKYSDAVQSGLGLLRDSKNRLFRSRILLPLQAIAALSKTIKIIKRQPKDFYLHVGRMDNKNKAMANILERIIYASFHTNETFQFILCDCKIAQLSIQHGLCEHSAHSFAMVGVFAALVFQQFEDATMFRELALATQGHYGNPRAFQTIFVSYQYSLVWTIPLTTCGSVFYDGYMKGMRNGEVDFAMWSLLSHFVQLPWVLGKPIDQILEECPKIVAQMEEMSQTSQALITKGYWQMFLNLRDPQQAQDPLKIKGEVLDVENLKQVDTFISVVHERTEAVLLIFYDSASAADRSIDNAGMMEKHAAGTYECMLDAFHRALSLYVAARRMKQRKYKQHAKKTRKQIYKWKRKGIPNVVYFCMFLDAEHAALAGKHAKAKKHYLEAIQFVAKSGFLQHAALFNELYSDYLLRERNDRDEAKYRLEEAIRYYEDWGALGKVKKLKESPLLT
ncbi:unnamed protein product [Cylindrotheca closterium]|uniref:Uncharacterized protein n=1 Tax=Cylindrotheca closterium TaxID=2856 RepID=A0AAD2CNF0_9STRA|nr:unnamed protein product [Cylindrotheca closterium]